MTDSLTLAACAAIAVIAYLTRVGGFWLMGSVQVGAALPLMGALTTMYPSLTSSILIVNLPGSLAWFVKFVKGFLCEASANKIELVNEFEELKRTFDEEGMPSYYRERGSITP